MSEKKYDLEERTYKFARKVALFFKRLPKNSINLEYIDQVVRASGSVGSNYIEANEALSKKDFVMRAKICRKEAKGSAYWLRLIVDTNSDEFTKEGTALKNGAPGACAWHLLNDPSSLQNFRVGASPGSSAQHVWRNPPKPYHRFRLPPRACPWSPAKADEAEELKKIFSAIIDKSS